RRAACERPLHGRLFGVACGESLPRVHAGDPEQEHVGRHAARSFGGDRAAGYGGVLVDAPAYQQRLDGGVIYECGGDRRAMGDHRGLEVARKGSHDGQRGGAAVEDHPITWADQTGGARGYALLTRRLDLPSRVVVRERRRKRERSAVHALAQPGGGELTQVATHAVFGHAELAGEVRGDELALCPEPAEEQLASLSYQHVVSRFCTMLHYTARLDGNPSAADSGRERAGLPLAYRPGTGPP